MLGAAGPQDTGLAGCPRSSRSLSQSTRAAGRGGGPAPQGSDCARAQARPVEMPGLLHTSPVL